MRSSGAVVRRLGSLCISAALVTAASSSVALTPVKAPPTVTITFIQREATSTLKPYLVHLTNAFMASHPQIHVNLLFEPSDSVLHEREEAMLAAKTPPTMGQVGPGWAQSYAAADAIVPLGPMIHGKNGLSPKAIAAIWPGMRSQIQFHGQTWMWPFNESDWVMFYNQQLVQRLHLTIPKTWTQFVKVADSIHAADTWAISVNPTDMGEGLALNMEEAFGSPIIKDGEPNFDTPAAAKALTLLNSLYQSGAMKIGSGYPGNVAFGSGHAIFHLTTTDGYYYDVEASEGKFTVATAPLPTGPAGRIGNMIGGDNLVIFAHTSTRQQQAAWTYIKWLTEPVQTAYWATHTGYLPVTRLALPLMKSYLATHAYKQIGIDELATSATEPELPNFSEAEDDLGNAFEAVLLEHESPSQALKEAQSQAVSSLP
jgi:multiple sugar transport system substrate-binding protein